MKRIWVIKEKSKTQRRSCASKYGYEQTVASPVQYTQGMSQPLSHHRQLVELLDSQPVFPYLLQNGALSDQDVGEISAQESRAKVNVHLLKKLEQNGRHAQNLLVNALRQTGQHHLANLLDEGIRIKSFTGSGYLSKKRRRGQVSLEIEVRAIKVPQETVFSLIKTPSKSIHESPRKYTREWVSIDDIRDRIASISESQTQLSSMQQFQIVESPDEPTKRCCLCACFASIFTKKQKGAAKEANTGSDRSEQYKYSDKNGNGVHLSPSPQVSGLRESSPNRYISHTTHITSTSSPKLHDPLSPALQLSSGQKQSRASMENLHSLLDMLQQKSDILYSVLQDPNSATRVKLLKYLEQSRGVLVLETEINEGLVIVNICTKLQQLEEIKRDFASGKLNKDFEGCIITDEVLNKMGVLGVKINTLVSEDDVELAEQELQS